MEMIENSSWARKPLLILWMILIVFMFVMLAIGFLKDNLEMTLTFLNIGHIESMLLVGISFAQKEEKEDNRS